MSTPVAAALLALAAWTTTARAQELASEPVGDDATASDGTRAIPAEVLALRDILVPAEIAGRVVGRPDDEAAAVQSGEVVVRLDDRSLEASAKAARAAVQRAEAVLEWARLEYARVQGLFESKSVGEADFDRARIARTEAEASLGEAAAVLSEREIHLERTRIRAPFEGRLVRIFPGVGEYVQIGTPAFRLVDLSGLRVVAYVPAVWLADLRVGMDLLVRHEGASSSTDRSVPVDGKGAGGSEASAPTTKDPAPLRAKLFSISPAAEGRSRTYRIEARAGAAGPFWRPGMTALLCRPAATARPQAHERVTETGPEAGGK